MRRKILLSLCLVLLAGQLQAQGSRLLRQPTISDDQIAFAYAGDIWIGSRDGGGATRLTTFPGEETQPRFSPDGQWLAFSGQYDGNTDVYVVPSMGGAPRRLTWHPRPDIPMGWSTDGSRVLFLSGRSGAPVRNQKLWQVEITGGLPAPLSAPEVRQGTLSPDGSRLAYRPNALWDEEWRNYRGGQNGPIWVLDLDDHDLVKVPWDGSSGDSDPTWIGDDVYFLSDRDYVKNVYRWRPGSSEIEQLTEHRVFDAKNLSAGGGMLVYEAGGYLHRLDPRTGDNRQLAFEVRGDLPWARPHWEDVGDQVRGAALSPGGKRAVFEARGEIFTVPVEKGDWRNLTGSSGAADRDPIWSPDGQSIAWFSDAGGEYALIISDPKGLEAPRRIELEDPTFYFTPAWSPDSKFILFTDEGLNLAFVDVESGTRTRIDTDAFAHPERSVDPVWSPDSRWIAYAKRLDSQFHAIMVYSLDDGETRQITDSLSDARTPAWDKSGDFLYFLSSTNFSISSGWLDLSSIEHEVRWEVYFAVLAKDTPSPLLPESDEEPDGDGDEDEGDEAEVAEADTTDEIDPVQIDFDGIHRRILSLSMPSRNYGSLQAGPEGVVFVGESIPNQPGLTLHKYSLETRESEVFLEGVQTAVLSEDGAHMLHSDGSSWAVVPTASAPSPGDGALDMSLRMRVDPRQEWRQIFREAWRFQRDFFYVDNVHGADWDWVFDAYSPWVEDVGHRSDLNHVLDVLGGETSVGHSFTGGGDRPDVETVSIGLLGVDLELDSGGYRIQRIFDGENWNADLRSPLAAPGIDIVVGDYIVAVNGQPLAPPTNPYSLFEGTADRQTLVRVAADAAGTDGRDVTVVPVSDDSRLRQRTWVEDNRRKVDELSDGRLAYIWLPNTGFGGYYNFNRYYFAQQDRQGAIVDERFNGGGFAADYVVDLLSRRLQGFFNNPVGDRRPFTNPGAGIWGPKVMIINESSGSGGDLMPWMFRNMEIGPLVGTRTWGGLVGIWDTPPLVDGGGITAPRGGFFTEEGWAVENVGVPPDIEVEMTPREVIAGHDPQLERAVEEALRLLEEGDWPQIIDQPADPIRSLRPDGP